MVSGVALLNGFDCRFQNARRAILAVSVAAVFVRQIQAQHALPALVLGVLATVFVRIVILKIALRDVDRNVQLLEGAAVAPLVFLDLRAHDAADISARRELLKLSRCLYVVPISVLSHDLFSFQISKYSRMRVSTNFRSLSISRSNISIGDFAVV